MLNLFDNALLIGFLTTAGVGILRNLFKEEIEYWFIAIPAYFQRPFDIDRDPNSKDWCRLFNEASGEWEVVALTTTLGFRKNKNGVYIYYYDREWILSHVERVPFLKWKQMRKAKLKQAPDFNQPKNE